MRTLDQTRSGTLPATHPGQSPARPAPAAVRVAYLLSQYPAISHTFFLHEVLGLRARGMTIETASINPPDRALSALPEREAAEARTTEYIKTAGKGAMLFRVLGLCVQHPAVLLRGLLTVLRQPRLTLAQRGMWLFYLAEAMLVGDWMRRRQLPHLHVHFGGPVASVGMLTAAAWGVPWSLTIHGPEELLNVDAYHLREKIHSAAFVFCISDFCRSQLCALTPPAAWSKFQVMRLGVDPVVLTPTADGQSSKLQLVCVGRLVPVKGHRILLEALSTLRERGLELHATLIGGGPELASLQTFAQEHGLSDTVTFTQALSHDAALAYVRAADIFCLASFAEGVPVAIMEAMSLGLACVSTTIAGIPELIASGVDGVLVPPSNALALTDALEALVTDAAYRRQLGTAARHRVIAQYNLPLNHERLAAAFAANLATETQERTL